MPNKNNSLNNGIVNSGTEDPLAPDSLAPSAVSSRQITNIFDDFDSGFQPSQKQAIDGKDVKARPAESENIFDDFDADPGGIFINGKFEEGVKLKPAEAIPYPRNLHELQTKQHPELPDGFRVSRMISGDKPETHQTKQYLQNIVDVHRLFNPYARSDGSLDDTFFHVNRSAKDAVLTDLAIQAQRSQMSPQAIFESALLQGSIKPSLINPMRDSEYSVTEADWDVFKDRFNYISNLRDAHNLRDVPGRDIDRTNLPIGIKQQHRLYRAQPLTQKQIERLDSIRRAESMLPDHFLASQVLTGSVDFLGGAITLGASIMQQDEFAREVSGVTEAFSVAADEKAEKLGEPIWAGRVTRGLTEFALGGKLLKTAGVKGRGLKYGFAAWFGSVSAAQEYQRGLAFGLDKEGAFDRGASKGIKDGAVILGTMYALEGAFNGFSKVRQALSKRKFHNQIRGVIDRAYDLAPDEVIGKKKPILGVETKATVTNEQRWAAIEKDIHLNNKIVRGVDSSGRSVTTLEVQESLLRRVKAYYARKGKVPFAGEPKPPSDASTAPSPANTKAIASLEPTGYEARPPAIQYNKPTPEYRSAASSSVRTSTGAMRMGPARPIPEGVLAQPEKPIKIPPIPSKGQKQEVMGVDAIVENAVRLGGVDYELYKSEGTKEGFVRIKDAESGKVVDVKRYPDFEQAKIGYDEGIQAAGEVEPVEPKPGRDALLLNMQEIYGPEMADITMAHMDVLVDEWKLVSGGDPEVFWNSMSSRVDKPVGAGVHPQDDPILQGSLGGYDRVNRVMVLAHESNPTTALHEFWHLMQETEGFVLPEEQKLLDEVASDLLPSAKKQLPDGVSDEDAKKEIIAGLWEKFHQTGGLPKDVGSKKVKVGKKWVTFQEIFKKISEVFKKFYGSIKRTLPRRARVVFERMYGGESVEFALAQAKKPGVVRKMSKFAEDRMGLLSTEDLLLNALDTIQAESVQYGAELTSSFAGKIPTEVKEALSTKPNILRQLRENVPAANGEDLVKEMGAEAYADHVSSLLDTKVAKRRKENLLAEQVLEIFDKDPIRIYEDFSPEEIADINDVFNRDFPTSPPVGPEEQYAIDFVADIEAMEAAAVEMSGLPKEKFELKPEAEGVSKSLKGATARQKSYAHAIKNDYDMTDDEYRHLAVLSTGKRSMVDMTSVEANEFIKALKLRAVPTPVAPGKPTSAKAESVKKPPIFTFAELQELAPHAGESMSTLEQYVRDKRIGGMPRDPKIRASFVNDLKTIGRDMERARKKKLKVEEAGGRYHFINEWQSANLAFGEAEMKSGVPLQRVYHEIVFGVSESDMAVDEVFNNAIQNIEKSIFGIKVPENADLDIIKWLGEEDVAARNKIYSGFSDSVKRVADDFHSYLQNETAFSIRKARFKIWDKADLVASAKIAGLKKGGKPSGDAIAAARFELQKSKPFNAPDSALQEGRQAMKDGYFDQWIRTQEWGTRKHYFMTEHITDDLTQELTELVSDGFVPGSIIGKGVGAPGAAKARVGRPKPIKGNSLPQAVLNHHKKIERFNAVVDKVEEFWNNFNRIDPSNRDIENAKNFIASALGKFQEGGSIVQLGQMANRWFWRTHLLNIPSGTFFAARNLLQNIAYGPSQVDMLVFSKYTMKVLHGGRTPELVSWADEHWQSQISQKAKLSHQFILQEEGKVQTAKNKAMVLLDTGSGIPIYTDEVNRKLLGYVSAEMGYGEASRFVNGEINYNTLEKNLKLNLLRPNQRIELKGLLDQGDVIGFATIYAQLKTQNVHFKYETALRSAVEQKPTGRLFSGVITYPRGRIELGYFYAWKPFAEGLRNKDHQKTWDGLKAMVFLAIGCWAADEVLYKITGKRSYGWIKTFTYTPMAPGVTMAKDKWDTVSYTLNKADSEEWSYEELSEAITKIGVDSMSVFVPGVDTMITYYEAVENKKKVTAWKYIMSKLQEDWALKHGTLEAFPDANRTWSESLQHFLFGKINESEKDKKWRLEQKRMRESLD